MLYLNRYAKPLVMLSLLVYGMQQTRGLALPYKYTWWAAMLLSLCGDVMLLSGAVELYFMLGLGAFLLAQISYAIAFNQSRKGCKGTSWLRRRPIIVFALLAYAVTLGYALWPQLGALKLPVVLYMAAILSMVMAAVNRRGCVSGLSYRLVALGAFFFMISDSILAWDRFREHVSDAGLWIMGTYILAQLGIFLGLLEQAETKPNA